MKINSYIRNVNISTQTITSMPERQPYTFDRVVRMVITIATVLLAIWLLNTLKGVLLPFCIACLIAYMLEPFVQFNRRLLHLRGRIAAIFITLFETAFLIGILCYFLIPSVIDEMHRMASLLQQYASTDMTIPFLPDSLHDFLKRNIDFEHLSSLFTGRDWMNIADGALSFISSGVNILISTFGWFIVVLYVVFIMIDYDRLNRGFRRMIPPRYRRTVLRIGNDIKTSMNHYFRGQALVAFLVGVLFSIGFLIIGLPLAVVLGLFIGVLNMVPYLQLISILPTTLLCLVYSADNGVSFWQIFGACIAVYAIVQVIQDFLLTPKIMGKAMGLNPAIILLSLSVWGTLLGLLGLIIALPLTTLLISYYNRYIIGNPNHTDM